MRCFFTVFIFTCVLSNITVFATKDLGKRDPNPYWFNMEIFAVIASNALKIRQVFSAAFSLYQQKSLKLNCSHLPMRCFSQDFSAEGCRQADACQIRQAERLQKHPSPGNACSSLVCLGAREPNTIWFKQANLRKYCVKILINTTISTAFYPI